MIKIFSHSKKKRQSEKKKHKKDETNLKLKKVINLSPETKNTLKNNYPIGLKI